MREAESRSGTGHARPLGPRAARVFEEQREPMRGCMTAVLPWATHQRWVRLVEERYHAWSVGHSTKVRAATQFVWCGPPCMCACRQRKQVGSSSTHCHATIVSSAGKHRCRMRRVVRSPIQPTRATRGWCCQSVRSRGRAIAVYSLPRESPNLPAVRWWNCATQQPGPLRRQSSSTFARGMELCRPRLSTEPL
jgi:hypothetical protein